MLYVIFMLKAQAYAMRTDLYFNVRNTTSLLQADLRMMTAIPTLITGEVYLTEAVISFDTVAEYDVGVGCHRDWLRVMKMNELRGMAVNELLVSCKI
jgi:hypothetical protein